MQFVRIFLFCFVISLLQNISDCDRRKIYYVQLVKNIIPASQHNLSQFSFDEAFGLLDPNVLRDSWTMCNEAGLIVNEGGGYIEISRNLQADRMRSYAVDTKESDPDPQFVQAFACPTRPLLYLRVSDRSNTLVIVIIVRQEDMIFAGLGIEPMHYTLKLVNEIRPIEQCLWLGNLPVLPRGADSYDDDQLPMIQRIDLCRRALTRELHEITNVTFLENTRTDIKRLYMLQSAANSLYTIVEAFACPTMPVIYLEVKEIKHNYSRMFWIRVIVAQTIPQYDPGLIARTTPYDPGLTAQTIPQYDPGPTAPTIPQYYPGPTVQNIPQYDPEPVTQTIPQYDPRPTAQTIPQYYPGPTVQTIPRYDPEPTVQNIPQYDPEPVTQTIPQYDPRPTAPNIPQYDPEPAEIQYQPLEIVRKMITPQSQDPRKKYASGEIEEQHLHMCLEAFYQVISQVEGRRVEFLENERPGNKEFYRVHFKNGQMDDILAFSCPTNPPTYLAVTPQKRKNIVRIFMVEEIEQSIFSRFNIVGYQVEIVADMAEVDMRRLREESPAAIIQTAVVNPGNDSPEDCKKLCEHVIPLVQEFANTDVKFNKESGIGLTKCYILKTESENRAFEYMQRPFAVQAFKCPSHPEIYLNVRVLDGGNVVWIYMKRSVTAPELKVLGFQVWLYKRITEVSDVESKSVKMSAVNTNQLDEKRRRQICRGATTHVASKLNIKFVENVDTGTQKYYALYRESEDGRMFRSFIQAFECPTEPAIYLHISDQENGHNVWIIAEIVSPASNQSFPSADFFTYELKLVVNITEASTQQITDMQATIARLENLMLDTDSFLEVPKFCRDLCEKAVQTSLEGKVDIQQDRECGPSLFYSVLEFEAQNNKPILIKAFQCPTEPPLYLQVAHQTYSTTVFAAKSHLIDVSKEFQYLVKIVENITEVPSHSDEFGSFDHSVVDTGIFTEKQRLRMCEESLKQLPLSEDIVVDFLDRATEPQKFYSLDLQSESCLVKAFNCPTKPSIHLEVHYWKSQGFTAWVIIKKRELTVPDEEPTLLVRPREPIREPPRGTVRDEGPTLMTRPREPIIREPPRDVTRQPRDIASTSAPRDIASTSAGISSLSEYEVKSYKIKFVEDIQVGMDSDSNQVATPQASSLMPSSSRVRSMVDTDKIYRESHRIQMCNHAIQMIPEQNVQLQGNSLTGRSNFFTVEEGFVGENISPFKLVRAFECPTKPPLFLEVRHREHKGTTACIIMKENKQIKYSIFLMPKFINTIEPAPNTSHHTRSSSEVSINEFSEPKRLQICKKAWKMVSNERFQLSSSDPFDESSDYILDSNTAYIETIRAFRCLTIPPIYLHIHRRIPGEYTVLIMKEQTIPTSVQSPSLPEEEPKRYDEVESKNQTSQSWQLLSSFSRTKNINYEVKYVQDITKAPPYRVVEIYERNPVFAEDNASPKFNDTEWLLICEDAMKFFPKIKFEFARDEKLDISRTYILNEGSENQDFVKAFKCPTTPVLHIQLKVNRGVPGFTAWILVVKAKLRSARTTGSFHDTFHDELQESQSAGEDLYSYLYKAVRKEASREN